MAEREKRYTPGPWWAGPTEDAHVVAEVGHYSVYPSGGTFGESDADAHLCAAAPELLEALEQISNALKSPNSFVEGEISMLRLIAADAISKAYRGDNQ